MVAIQGDRAEQRVSVAVCAWAVRVSPLWGAGEGAQGGDWPGINLQAHSV